MKYGNMSVTGTKTNNVLTNESSSIVKRNPQDIKLFDDANGNGIVDADDFGKDKGFAKYLENNGYFNNKIQWGSFKDIVNDLYNAYKSLQSKNETAAQTSSNPPETGNIRAIKNEDGTTTVYKLGKGFEKETLYDDENNVVSETVKYENGDIGTFDFKNGVGIFKDSNGNVIKEYKIQNGKLTVVEKNNESIPQKDNDDSEVEVTPQVKERMKKLSVDVPDLKYTISDDGIASYTSNNISTANLSGMVKFLPKYYNPKTRMFTRFGVSSGNESVLNKKISMRLTAEQAIYNDLTNKPENELSDGEKKFIQKHEQTMSKFFQEYDKARAKLDNE